MTNVFETELVSQVSTMLLECHLDKVPRQKVKNLKLLDIHHGSLAMFVYSEIPWDTFSGHII